ncbi:hypothetical protein BRC93_15695 [Halobacteriales archaeon QS_5_70_15]|jgi:hypothetical protein|nr:MAG: hypothetical protein BRC93_15695 [Halobacteriales archaeon QS_5_70_15]
MRDRDDEGIRDPVANALLGDSTYERLRQTRYSPFSQRIPTKIVVQSGLLFLLALMLPVMAAFPAEVRAMLGGSAFSSSPRVLVLGLVGGVVVFSGGVALTVVGFLRVHLEPRMTERLANRLLSLEDVASLLGIGTGGIAILLTMAYVLMGYVSVRAVEWYVDTMGISPFASSGIEPVTVGGVATLAFVGSVALLVASQALHMETRLRLGEEYTGSPLAD